jgi:hypothetical protein
VQADRVPSRGKPTGGGLISSPFLCGVVLSSGADPEAQNEYDSYISGIYRLLNGGADKVKMIGHLRQLETVSMGLKGP